MSEIFKIVGVCLLTLICYLIIKPLKPDIAIFVSLIGAVIMLFMCVDGLMNVISTMTSFAEKTGINTGLFGLILKIVGIGYLTEFSSSICCNAGNSTLSDIIGFAGKITILIVSLPIITSLIDIIVEILP
ncbi:MAG: hypothetical protein E7378_00115 [Clostridiales bacterium]|nr:hypothetical protein [Clostridiales bacterium]